MSAQLPLRVKKNPTVTEQMFAQLDPLPAVVSLPPPFVPFGKIPRLSQPVVITEKIDGTNGLVRIERVPWGYGPECEDPTAIVVQDETEEDPETLFPLWQYVIRAGSRKRWLTKREDNYGFRAWVEANAQDLINLGTGDHHGEWFGKGIQHGYGLDEKRFALFNVGRWYDPRDYNPYDRLTEFPKANPVPECCSVVPWITSGSGADLTALVNASLDLLRDEGSRVRGARWETAAEGVIVFHTAASQLFKVLLVNDNIPKSVALKAAA